MGKKNQEIADELGISRRTVEKYNRGIYSHLGIAKGKKARLSVLYHAYLKGLRRNDTSA